MYSGIVNRSVVKNISAAASNAARCSGARQLSSSMHDNDPNVLELEKKRNLSRLQHKTSTPIGHAPGWNEALASASEAAVKADRAPLMPAEELQRITVDYVLSRYPAEERLGSKYSTEDPDVVSGPLSSKGTEETHHETIHDVYHIEREEISGPLRRAKGREDVGESGSTKKQVKVEEEILRAASEENVKADRGEI